MLGLLNSTISAYVLTIMNPTLAFQVGNIAAIPYIDTKDKSYIEDVVQQNIRVSKSDWDAHETSWDFQHNELLSIDSDTYMENK